jgi:hypothetical protein
VESTLLAGEKSKKKRGNLGDSARGQADPGSAAVYTMDWPGPVICMYVCTGTVSHPYGPTDPLVVALAILDRYALSLVILVQAYLFIEACSFLRLSVITLPKMAPMT